MSTQSIAVALVQSLTASAGINDFCERILPLLAHALGARRSVLIDYRENTGRFDLLHFSGYASEGRYELQHRIREMSLQRALEGKLPFFGADDRLQLYLPLYFSTTLEALLVFEAESAIDLDAERLEVCKMAAKFVGLLLSSSRLGVNQAGVVDLNDLQRARQIQLSYLPAENLETDRYEVYGYNQSSALVGGDYFDYFRLRDNSIQCVLADASGHGLSAALIMSTFRGLLRAELDQYPDGGELFTILNRSVHSGSTIVQYLTTIFLDYNEKTGLLKYVNAGHFEPALIRSDGVLERLAGGGPPLGMFGTTAYACSAMDVRPGDLMVLFTDGFTDLRNAADEFFGEERIIRYVQQHRTRPLKEIASVLLNEGMSFSATPQPEDDLTLFLVRFR